MPESIALLTDCMEYMQSIPDKWFDLACVDPPYGIGQDGRNNHTRGRLAKAKDYRNSARYDNAPPNEEYFTELFRISKNQIIWGANHFISKIPYDSSCWIIWDKDNSGNNFGDGEMAYTSFKTRMRIFKYTWNGMLQENMKQKEIRIHPNHKPIALYDWIFLNYAKPGDKIYDSHLGSGSSRIAAYKNNLDFFGTEIDRDYYNASVKRFEIFKAQQTINFNP